MMSLWDALRMNMMISYQELVRTFPRVILLNTSLLNRLGKLTTTLLNSQLIGPLRKSGLFLFLLPAPANYAR